MSGAGKKEAIFRYYSIFRLPVAMATTGCQLTPMAATLDAFTKLPLGAHGFLDSLYCMRLWAFLKKYKIKEMACLDPERKLCYWGPVSCKQDSDTT